MNWRVKVFTERALSRLPCRHQLNRVLQSLRAGLGGLERNARRRAPDIAARIAGLARHVPLEGASVFEVGTGFGLPTLLLHLAGAREIRTYDAVRQLNFGHVGRALRVLREDLSAWAAALGVAEDVAHRRLAALESTRGLDDLLAKANIVYRAPADATATGLPPRSFNVYYSVHVLECVPFDVLHGLCREACRLLKSTGRFYALLGCTSDYATIDRSLHAYHYLAYTDEEWERLAVSRMKCLNRLREPEYLELFEQSGGKIEAVSSEVRPEDVEVVKDTRLAPRFARFTPQQNAVRRTEIIVSFQP